MGGGQVDCPPACLPLWARLYLAVLFYCSRSMNQPMEEEKTSDEESDVARQGRADERSEDVWRSAEQGGLRCSPEQLTSH